METSIDPQMIDGMTKPEAHIAGLVMEGCDIVAAGTWYHAPKAGSDRHKQRSAVWYSTDNGANWQEIDPFMTFEIKDTAPFVRINDLTLFDGDFIAVGNYGSNGAVWIGKWSD